MDNSLFDLEDFKLDAADLTPAARARFGRSALRKLTRARRALSEEEKNLFDHLFARLARELKFHSSLSDRKDDLIILAVLAECAHSREEISEETQFSDAKVRDILERLLDAGAVVSRRRGGIGGSVKQTLFYSTRRKCACVLEDVFRRR